MQRAIELAAENVHAGLGGPFGAIVVKDGSVVAEGTNLVTSTNDPTAHAEVVVIRRACHALARFQLTGCELYTSCEPCPMCLSDIYWARLKTVYYGNTRKDAQKIEFDDDLIYEEVATPIERRKIPMKQLLRLEALAAFKEWGNKADKIRY